MINRTNQSGRSMVEMLGVLAIIGVLSVGGIAGYTMAMNKHRANEILNAASVRAMVVSAKLQQNSTADISNALAEFGNETIAGAVFGAAESVGTSQFKINFTTAPDTPICDQMKAIVGDNGIIKDWGTDCDALTYNNDLTNADPAPVPSKCPGDKDPKADGTCDDDACTDNSNCKSGYFCNYDGDVDGDGCGTGGTNGGSCALANGTSLTVADDGIDGFKSSDTLDWYSAKNFCQAKGMHMVSFNESSVNVSALGAYFESNGYCYDPNSENKAGGDECGEGSFAMSNYIGKLSSTYWWVSDEHFNSCLAFAVYTADEEVVVSVPEDEEISGRNSRNYALCE